MKKGGGWQSQIMVATFILLVCLPVFKAYLPTEVAKWYIAAAENSAERKDFANAEFYLAKSITWSPEIENSADYLEAQVHLLARQGEVGKALKLLAASKPSPSSNFAKVAASLSTYFFMQGDFEQALDALSIHGEDLNQLAYLRALTGKELDAGLADIDKLLAENEVPELQDTKAWVLHRMQKHAEASAIMNKAFEGVSTRLASEGFPLGVAADSKDPKDQEFLRLHREQLERIYAIPDRRERYVRHYYSPLGKIAIYHYHRQQIRQANGEVEAAAEDQAWLDRHGFTDTSLLY